MLLFSYNITAAGLVGVCHCGCLDILIDDRLDLKQPQIYYPTIYSSAFDDAGISVAYLWCMKQAFSLLLSLHPDVFREYIRSCTHTVADVWMQKAWMGLCTGSDGSQHPPSLFCANNVFKCASKAGVRLQQSELVLICNALVVVFACSNSNSCLKTIRCSWKLQNIIRH